MLLLYHNQIKDADDMCVPWARQQPLWGRRVLVGSWAAGTVLLRLYLTLQEHKWDRECFLLSKNKVQKPIEQGMQDQDKAMPKQNYNGERGSADRQHPAPARTPSLLTCLQPMVLCLKLLALWPK